MNNNKPKYWFKRKRYGYGWTPVTWQGWLTVIIFLAVTLSGTVALEDTPKNTYSPEVLIYMVLFIIATLLLLFIAYKKGPSPKWRWGKKETDNPDMDI